MFVNPLYLPCLICFATPFSRRVSDISDVELPPLEPLFGPHLYFHPEEETTPDENDLFPSTPLDEEQLAHADSKLQVRRSILSGLIRAHQILFLFIN